MSNLIGKSGSDKIIIDNLIAISVLIVSEGMSPHFMDLE